jgi:nickel/cobalt transporter (NicO) family protein
MRLRRLVALAVAVAAMSALPAPAGAHPLGNFSINHLVTVRVSAHQVDLHYVLDQAEIPTFQERDLPGTVVLARKRAEVRRRLSLSVAGRGVPLRMLARALLTHPPGQGGLPLTCVELWLTASLNTPPRGVVGIHDGTFPDRVGWKAIVAAPGSGTAVRSSVPSSDPTHGLRSYPQGALSSPLDQRDATLVVRPGDGTVIAPNGHIDHSASTRNRSGDGFAGIFADAAAGKGVLLFLLLAAFGWGAIHALSPGHGKSMVAAYLIGTRGQVRDAVALGATVTITHTIGVFALGLVTLALSQYVLPEQLYPWLNLVSGLLVVAIGLGVLRSRVKSAHHDHQHHHHHHDHLARKSIVAMGASAGLLPCPSALVVLLAAIAQHRIALGLLMIVVFSLGLATTLTGLGVAVVSAGRVTHKLSVPPRVALVVPAVSALVIVLAGTILTIKALPQVA